MVYVFLADGFEITEAMAPVDMMRRAGIDVKTVGVYSQDVESSCGVKVSADITKDAFDISNADALVIPGGMPGVTNLCDSEFVVSAVKEAYEKNILLCAICAGPSLLGRHGLLNGKKAICYPGFEQFLKGAEVMSDSYVVTDGRFITARGAGVSVEFGLEIVKCLTNEETSEKIRKQIQCR